MADFFKNFDKYVKDWHILTLLGLLILGYIIYEYSCRQNLLVSNYQGLNAQIPNPSQVQANTASNTAVAGGTSASTSIGATTSGPVAFDNLQNDLNGPAVISSIPSNVENVSGSTSAQMDAQMDPSQLLPKNTNNEWVQSQSISPGMNGMNFLGLTEKTTVLRNANQQLRADPPIPQGPCPTMCSTITGQDTGPGLKVDC